MAANGETAREVAKRGLQEGTRRRDGGSTKSGRRLSIWRYLLILLLFLGIACAGTPPLDRLQQSFKDHPEYSISLEDMKEEGNFLKEYYHRYKVVWGQRQAGAEELEFKDLTTDWYKVSEKEYEANKNNLGMVLASKTRDEGVTASAQPPGYQYVGDSRYGTWRTDQRGNSFWEFYGKYAFFSHMFGMMRGPVYRSNWDTYRDYRSRGQPFYGRGSEYGTSGSYTRTVQKDFFQRRKAREAATKTRFSDKVKSRVRRSKMSGVRTRSSGFGK